MLEYSKIFSSRGVLPGGGKGVNVIFSVFLGLLTSGEWEEFYSALVFTALVLKLVSAFSDSFHSTWGRLGPGTLRSVRSAEAV